jgi:hypothetical protein
MKINSAFLVLLALAIISLLSSCNGIDKQVLEATELNLQAESIDLSDVSFVSEVEGSRVRGSPTLPQQTDWIPLELSVQGSPCEIDKLDEAIADQGLLFERLSRMRGFPSVRSEVFSGLALESVVPNGTAVLIYHRAAEEHCAWLVDSNGVREFASIKMHGQVPAALLRLFYRVEGIEAAQLRRAPRLRNEAEERDIGRSKPESKYSSSQIMNTMAKILLPGRIRQDIQDYKSIVIVPYGNIGSFPFSAIPVEGNKTLIDFASIEVAPSLVDLYGAWAGSNVMGGIDGESRWDREGYFWLPPGCDGDTKGNEDDPDWGSPLIVGDPDYSSDPDFVFPSSPALRVKQLRSLIYLMSIH